MLEFVLDQIKKTIRRPSRLHIVPCNLARHSYSHLCQLFLAFANRGWRVLMYFGVAPEFWPKLIRKLEAQRCFDLAQQLLDENKPRDAWEAFARCLRLSDNYLHFKVAAVCLQVGLGRTREAIKLQQKSDGSRSARGASLGVKETGYRVLDGFWTAHIGHVAQIDYIAKLAILDGWTRDIILYLAPGAKVGNRFLLNQWSPHLRVIERASDLPFPEQFVEYEALNFYVPRVKKDSNLYLWELAAQTYRRWNQQGRGPLLKLPAEIESRGRDVLAQAGVPRNAWFVCLHVRGPEFSVLHRTLHHVLNARIADYLPAIKEVVQRGGWVIRLGNPMMEPLPPMANVLDYSHSAIRSEWMDVYLAASCRMFVGTSSGVCYVAQNYGVPCVLSNWWPPAQRPWQRSDIFVPKLYRRMRSREFLTLEQSLREPFGYCNSLDYLMADHGVLVEDNDPEDIRAAAVEMLDGISDAGYYDERDLSMRRQADKIYADVANKLYASSGAFGAASLARDFLRRHSALLKT